MAHVITWLDFFAGFFFLIYTKLPLPKLCQINVPTVQHNFKSCHWTEKGGSDEAAMFTVEREIISVHSVFLYIQQFSFSFWRHFLHNLIKMFEYKPNYLYIKKDTTNN